MHRIFELLMSLIRDEGFLEFQNNLALDIYDELEKGYSGNENEVSLVTRICDITKGKSYGPISLYSDKIHGSRSYVEFNYMNKPVTKELGDMVIITIVSDRRKRLLQRLCIIQNKKGKKGHGDKDRENTNWGIDLEQLYLLKNFPKLTGNKGILRNCHEVAFRNFTGCLGAFGLLDFPGEMVFIAAPLLTELLKGKKSLNKSDISVIGGNHTQNTNGGVAWPLPFFHSIRHPKEWVFLYEELVARYGHMWPYMFGFGMPFFGNTPFLRDIYDFVRSWTQVNIGETSLVFGEVTNARVDGFANALLRQIGLGEVVDLPVDPYFAEYRLEGQLGIVVTHIDIGKMKKL